MWSLSPYLIQPSNKLKIWSIHWRRGWREVDPLILPGLVILHPTAPQLERSWWRKLVASSQRRRRWCTCGGAWRPSSPLISVPSSWELGIHQHWSCAHPGSSKSSFVWNFWHLVPNLLLFVQTGLGFPLRWAWVTAGVPVLFQDLSFLFPSLVFISIVFLLLAEDARVLINSRPHFSSSSHGCNGDSCSETLRNVFFSVGFLFFFCCLSFWTSLPFMEIFPPDHLVTVSRLHARVHRFPSAAGASWVILLRDPGSPRRCIVVKWLWAMEPPQDPGTRNKHLQTIWEAPRQQKTKKGNEPSTNSKSCNFDPILT